MISTIGESALALSRWVELSILAKATAILALGLAGVWLATHARASVRHLMLTATFAALITLPLAIVSAPPVAIEVPVSHARGSIADAMLEFPPDTPVRLTTEDLKSYGALVASWPTLVRWAWIAGATLLLLPVARDLWRLRRIRRTSLPWPESRGLARSLAAECGVRRGVEILLHEDLPAPLTCGVWRPAIVLPADAREWSEAGLRRALVHELEHVRRGDWASQLAARLACACYWFHPLVWVAWRRLCLEAERACDDAVVRGAECTEYAEQLVELARRMSTIHAHSAPGMAHRSDLSARVSALLDGSQRRGRAGLAAAVCAMSVASLAVLAIAPVHAVAQSTSKQRPRASALDRALFEAAADGDVSGVNGLLNAGANVNAALSADGTPLIGAARRGHIAAVQLLLDRDADPNLAVPGDGNPLIMAAREGHVNVVMLLLDRGARIDQVVPGDENALIQASGNGHLDIVKLLVARRADVNAKVWVETYERPGGEWRTPLSMARKGRHKAVVSYLLSAGARE